MATFHNSLTENTEQEDFEICAVNSITWTSSIFYALSIYFDYKMYATKITSLQCN